MVHVPGPKTGTPAEEAPLVGPGTRRRRRRELAFSWNDCCPAWSWAGRGRASMVARGCSDAQARMIHPRAFNKSYFDELLTGVHGSDVRSPSPSPSPGMYRLVLPHGLSRLRPPDRQHARGRGVSNASCGPGRSTTCAPRRARGKIRRGHEVPAGRGSCLTTTRSCFASATPALGGRERAGRDGGRRGESWASSRLNECFDGAKSDIGVCEVRHRQSYQRPLSDTVI